VSGALRKSKDGAGSAWRSYGGPADEPGRNSAGNISAGKNRQTINWDSAAMKQKNLAMLGVAVGCGLVAAVAVAKLSAGGSRGPDTTKVLVAKKDLAVQTTLDEKELDNLVGWADMPKNLVPPDAVTDIE